MGPDVVDDFFTTSTHLTDSLADQKDSPVYTLSLAAPNPVEPSGMTPLIIACGLGNARVTRCRLPVSDPEWKPDSASGFSA